MIGIFQARKNTIRLFFQIQRFWNGMLRKSISCASCDWQTHVHTHMKIHPKKSAKKGKKIGFKLSCCQSWWQEFRSDNISFNLNSDIWNLSRTALDSLFLRKALKTLMLQYMWIPVRICHGHLRTGAYLQALQPRLSPAQPGRDRWGEQHKAPCPADSSPSFPNSLLLLSSSSFSPVAPLTSLQERVASLLHSPAVRRSLFTSALPHKCLLLTSAKVYCFSFSCLSHSLFKFLFGPQRNVWGDISMAGKELPNSSSVAERGVFSFLYLYSNLIIFYSLK